MADDAQLQALNDAAKVIQDQVASLVKSVQDLSTPVGEPDKFTQAEVDAVNEKVEDLKTAVAGLKTE